MMEQWHPLGRSASSPRSIFPSPCGRGTRRIAAVCGDTVIWKPAEPTPLCAIAVQHIANRVMADHGVPGVFTLAVGAGRTVGERMLDDPRLPLVSFTGSTRDRPRMSARRSRAASAARMLELGGNNAIIVTADADLDLAVRAILFGAVGTAGQRCTSTRRHHRPRRGRCRRADERFVARTRRCQSAIRSSRRR